VVNGTLAAALLCLSDKRHEHPRVLRCIGALEGFWQTLRIAEGCLGPEPLCPAEGGVSASILGGAVFHRVAERHDYRYKVLAAVGAARYAVLKVFHPAAYRNGSCPCAPGHMFKDGGGVPGQDAA